jgi:S-formylglutathione hydrolase FrmB
MVVAAPAAKAGSVDLVSVQHLSPRLEELRVYSPALARQVNVRVLTPAGFDPARQQLPVLWLLHGGFADAGQWTNDGGATELTAGLPMIVVMPDAGIGGWYSDWVRWTQQGPQKWETFHIAELRPFIEKRYNTRTDRDGRAVAGLSMGGFGAMHYAVRYPELFGFAASFSGAVDNLHPGVAAVIMASPLAHQGIPGDIFGDPVVARPNWQANNPVDLAENLRHTEVQIRTGNGQPGGPHGGGFDIQEYGVWQASRTLHQRLDALGIPHLFVDYGPGAHTFEYWHDDLAATLPRIAGHFAEHPIVTTSRGSTAVIAGDNVLAVSGRRAPLQLVAIVLAGALAARRRGLPRPTIG